jgi:flagellar basal-body rod modification protein FlgD
VNPIAPVGSTTVPQTTPASSASPSSPSSLLSEHTFLDLLVDQLKYQDPLSPMSGAQFMSQVAQLSEVETMQTLAQDISKSSSATELASATKLIGSSVQAITKDGTKVSGIVSAVKLREGSPELVVDGTTIHMDDLAEVQGASGLAAPSGSTSSTPTDSSSTTG